VSKARSIRRSGCRALPFTCPTFFTSIVNPCRQCLVTSMVTFPLSTVCFVLYGRSP
jgi:hypothetical protein